MKKEELHHAEFPPRSSVTLMIALFYMVIEDEDNGSFTVEGPLTDDRWWINRLSALRQAGRHVRCYHVEQSKITKEVLIASISTQTSYKFNEAPEL